MSTAYELRGDCRRLFSAKEHEVVLAGAADSGKTVACCLKAHTICASIPGAQGAIARKSYASLVGTVLRTFARIIKGQGVQTFGGENPARFIYPNGSVIWLGGLDNSDRMLSSERDFIYVNQCEELALADWETLATRCSGRASVIAVPQIFGDCNPGGSKHWIRMRAKSGRLKLLTATHRDNPTIYSENGELTVDGAQRLKVLQNLTGVRRKRLLEGVWATAEGAVYDNFDPAVHVRTRDRREMKRFFLAIDDGFTNPAVILDIGEDTDGRWHCFREFHQAGQMRETVVATAAQWHAEFRREAVAVDEAVPELVEQLKRRGLPAVGGKGAVLDGIRKVQDRLAVAGDGLPRYTLDPSCVEHQNEFESYVWKPMKDVPEKANDHSLDALRYLCDVVAGVSAFSGAAGFRAGPPDGPERFVAERLNF